MHLINIIPLSVWGALGVLMSILLVWTIFGAAKRFKSDAFSMANKAAIPLMNFDRPLANTTTKEEDFHQNNKPELKPPPAEAATQAPSRSITETWQPPSEGLDAILQMSAIAGDYIMILASFVLSILVIQSDAIPFLAGVAAPTVPECSKMILCASAFLLWGLKSKELYVYRNLLAPSKIWHKLVGALGFTLFAFLVVSLLVRMEPAISWVHVVVAAIIMFPLLCGWRLAFSYVIRHPALACRLRRRLIVIGGGSQTLRIQRALTGDLDMEFVGWVQANKPNHITELDEFRLGPLHELGSILRRNNVNVAVLTESESLQREGVLAVAKACEIEHVQFKMVPHFFEILVSGVRPENIGGMQLLGVHSLPLYGFRNRFVKRTVDILGAIVGLTLAFPVIAFFGAVVYWESPGPIFYRQIRQGRNGRLFHIIKIRSMRMNAEADGEAKWAQKNDNRRLRIGTFMRKYNIDEVPQFWNVLCGQMSLVGPRPERPELIAHFKSRIPHYQARHMYQPGMTGWAQVNGWRGNTCLEERIRHDIWYLENWTVWLDLRIMVQTLVKQKNAY